MTVLCSEHASSSHPPPPQAPTRPIFQTSLTKSANPHHPYLPPTPTRPTHLKRALLLILKALGSLLLVLALAAAALYLWAANYEQQSVLADPAKLTIPDDDYHAAAARLVAEMTFEEKVAQMYGEPYVSGLAKFLVNAGPRKRFPHVYVGGNERLGIPPWVLSDGPRGARVLGENIDAVTTFPVAMARGASWNPDLEYRVHAAIAKEMRANGTNYGATPCINLLRHPGWGRAQETYGEDPWHLGAFGVAAVRGLEDHRVMACPKHYALNSIENSRWVVDVRADERTLREVYLPHFRRTVQQGRPASIMSAYNLVNGDFAGESRHLLTDILRDEWGFDGFVTTDWLFGLYDGVKGVNAGLHVEMPFRNAYDPADLQAGIDAGLITETQIDTLVRQSLRTRLPYAFVDAEHQYGREEILSEAHVALARKAAEEGMVLLRNEGDVLPFGKTSGKTVAVIGRLADVPNTGDEGSSNATPPYVVTPYAGLRDYHATLGNEVALDDGSDLERARRLAERADEVIVVVGFTKEDEGEYIILSREKMVESARAGQLVGERGSGGDRKDLRLRPEDVALIKALAPANPQTAIVYIGGSAIDMAAWHEDVPAVLFAWYAGMEGGNALARVLYGDVNPSGKLPFTIAADQADYPPFNPYTETADYGYYHGYTLLEKGGKQPLYAFGFGESYTDFTLDSLTVETPVIGLSDSLRVSFRLTNTGDMAGAEVVQLYIGFDSSRVERPGKLLRAFRKLSLNEGSSLSAKLAVAADDLRYYNPDRKQWELEPIPHQVYVGTSSEDIRLVGEVHLH